MVSDPSHPDQQLEKHRIKKKKNLVTHGFVQVGTLVMERLHVHFNDEEHLGGFVCIFLDSTTTEAFNALPEIRIA